MPPKKKLTGSRTSRRKKSPATTRSTAGAGFDFEDQVGAWLLLKFLAGEALPGINVTGVQLQAQTSSIGWHIDDLLATSADDAGERHQLAISCKSNVQVTSAGLPPEFIGAAWELWRNPGDRPFNRATDHLALVTRGRNSTFDAIWSDIRNWCSGGATKLGLNRINQSAKHRKVFSSVKRPSQQHGVLATDEETIALIQRLSVIPLDFQIADSKDESDAVARCRRIVREGSLVEGRRLWSALIQRARNTRLGNGTLQLLDLWVTLRPEFLLNDHPDFASSWAALTALARDYKSSVELSFPSGNRLERLSLAEKFVGLIGAAATVVVYGDSGNGKSALVKSTIDKSFPNANQVWLRSDELELALSETNRSKLSLSRPLSEVLLATAHSENIFVLDSAEKLTPEGASKASQLIQGITQGPARAWRAIIVGQTEAWVDGRLLKLTAISSPASISVPGASPEDVKSALRTNPSLHWLASDDGAVSALTNLRTLSWVMQASAVFEGHQLGSVLSHTSIVDLVWGYWTDGRPTLQRLLMRLAEREASFERTFAVTELDAGDVAAFESAPPQLPLRLNSRNRIEFNHDLAAEWARFQRLKEISTDTAKWAGLASNPLWSGALRLLGQLLLREKSDGRTRWDIAFESLDHSEDNPDSLAADVLLDALCLDPFAAAFLSSRADLLLRDNGARLSRLLRRFQYMATTPSVPEAFRALDESYRIHLETRYRVPIVERWPSVAAFLWAHKDQVPALLSPVVSKVCEIWLAGTPAELGPGIPVPYRREFAEIALQSARALQVGQGRRIIFLDDFEKPIYSAAFAAARDLPDEVSEWALEMARRRPTRKDVVDQITEHRRREANDRAERMRTDPVFRAREEERRESIRSMPTLIPSGRKLPPWPLGPRGRVERDFREGCVHKGMLTTLMGIRPEAAAEVLLAVLIEQDPEEPYNERAWSDERLGLDYDGGSYPTAYWKSPFFHFLQMRPEVALRALLQLLDFCTDQWLAKRTGKSISILLGDTARTFIGDRTVFDWPQENSSGDGQIHSALAALEKWLCLSIDKGVDVTDYLQRILLGTKSVAGLGVLVNVGKYSPLLFAGVLRPLLGSAELFLWDDYRVKQLPYHFDALNWGRAGDAVLRAAHEWVLARYRQRPLRQIVSELLNTDASVAEFLNAATPSWKLPDSRKAALEFRLLVAQLDARNYSLELNAEAAEMRPLFRCPATLTSEIDAYNDALRPALDLGLWPARCERIIESAGFLDDAQAQLLAATLDTVSASSELDKEDAHQAAVAISSALIVKASSWLAQRPEMQARVETVVQAEVDSIGASPESVRREYFSVGRLDELRFAARAVAHRWIYTPSKEWDRGVLRVLTSGNARATMTLMLAAHGDRERLGDRWWRLLEIGILWCGLSALTSRFDDPAIVETLWIKWLRQLRSWGFNRVSGPAKVVPLGVAKRVERLKRSRAMRSGETHRRKRDRFSSGLNTQLLEYLFTWLLGGQTREKAGAISPTDRELLRALWDFEVWRKYEDVGSDGEFGPPSHLGYAVLSELAGSMLSLSSEEGVKYWQPVLAVGADAHYSIGHFLNSLFLHVSRTGMIASFLPHWRSMIVYAMGATNWFNGRRWFYGERLLSQLLGFSADFVASRDPQVQASILSLRDLYETWARSHLHRDEENIAGFSAFLASPAAAALRLEGIQWLAQSIKDHPRAAKWYRDHTSAGMVELLNVALSNDADRLAANQDARNALLRLAAQLVSIQVPSALALHERIQKLR